MNILVRAECAGDRDAVFRVNESAFETDAEALLVDRLRQLDDAISLVATVDDIIAGHIMFSRVWLDPEIDGVICFGLAPMSVLPEFQQRGIGSALVEHGLDECRRRCINAVFVLGHAEYYPRFGFEVAARSGFRCEYDSPEECFMVIKLNEDSLANACGLVKYDEVFSTL
jgi:putative acetyltransferase